MPACTHHYTPCPHQVCQSILQTGGLTDSRVLCTLRGIEKKRKDYTFRRQFNEKPSIIPGCPEIEKC